MSVMYLMDDLRSYAKDASIFTKAKVVFLSHAFHLVFFCRLGFSLGRSPFIGSFVRVVFEYAIRIIFSSDISLKAKLGSGLMIVHGHDIVIGGDVRVGQNCKILNGVTLGNKDTEVTVNAQPTLGDNVVIGSGAKILGGIVIGNNVKIGANSVVLQSFPSDLVIVGVPARAVHQNNG